ncbi:CPBP family intramembrane glutamic endopeptidase [Candidatus Omnitrophota bacterium]
MSKILQGLDLQRKSNYLRLMILFFAVLAPIILLRNGIFGSFVFTFSIPLLWQVSLKGKPLSSLGLSRRFLGRSIFSGLVTGAVIALVCAAALNLFGIRGYVFSSIHKLEYSLGAMKISFSLERELGYRLLTASNSARGFLLYLLFSILAIGLGEELFWRGFIQKKLSGRFKENLSIWLSAILYGLSHFYIFLILPARSAIIFLAGIVVIGAFWGYLFKFCRNIWAPAISHGLVAFIIWKYYFFTSS